MLRWLTLAALLAACDPPSPVAEAKITVVGYRSDSVTPVSFVWSGGAAADLPGYDGGWTKAYGVWGGGETRIIVGACSTAAGVRACQFHDGAWTLLEGGDGYSEARAIDSARGVVTVGGWITDMSTGYPEQVPCLWTDGVVAELRGSDGADHVYAVAVDGTDVYAAGDSPTTSGGNEPVMWKNGARDRLGSDTGTAYAVAAEGGAVAAGGVLLGSTATIWQGGDATSLGYGVVRALAWDGGDLLAVAGAQLWRGGEATTLDDSFAADATALAAAGGAWIAAGTWGGTLATVCVWDETGRRDLFTADGAVVTGVFLEP